MDKIHIEDDQFIQFLLHTSKLLSSVLLSPSHTRINEINQSRPEGMRHCASHQFVAENRQYFILVSSQVYGDQFGIEEPQTEFMRENVKHGSGGIRFKDRSRNRKVSDQNNSQTSLRNKENIILK